MRQKIEAGKTAVGTKVEAELALATLVEGTVMAFGVYLARVPFSWKTARRLRCGRYRRGLSPQMLRSGVLGSVAGGLPDE